MRVSYLLCSSALFALYSLAHRVETRIFPPGSVLQSLGVDTSTFPPIMSNPTQTCKILQSLFPQNETFTASSNYYIPLYEIPW